MSDTLAKEIAAHARTVHIAFLVLCLILLGATLDDTKEEYRKAIYDARLIASIGAPDVHPNEKLFSLLQEEAKSETPDDNKFLNHKMIWIALLCAGDQRPQTFHVEYPLRWFYNVQPRSEFRPDSAFFATVGYPLVDFSAFDLLAFRAFWNHNQSGQVYLIPTFAKEAVSAKCDSPASKGSATVVSVTLMRRRDPIDGEPLRTSVEDSSDPASAFGGTRNNPSRALLAALDGDSLKLEAHTSSEPDFTHRDAQVAIRVPLIPMNKNVQDLVGGLIAGNGGEVGWPPGKFEDTFPQLSSLAKRYSLIPIRELPARLQQDAKSQEDKLEVFGVKLPREQIQTWGLLMMLGFEFYLFVLSRTILKQSKLGASEGLAWVALYNSWDARLFTFLSLGALPVAVLGYIVVAMFADLAAASGAAEYVVAGVVILSLVVIFGTMRVLREIRRATS